MDNIKEVNYEGPLSEKILKEILPKIFTNCSIISQHRIKTSKKTFIVDFYIPEINLIIEFNGDRHYRQISTIERDKNLKIHCKKNKIKLANLPYWVQLTDAVAIWAFGDLLYNIYIKDKINLNPKFSNGFISYKCTFPADFSTDGWDLFYKEYVSFIEIENFSVPQQIWESLDFHIKRKNLNLIMGFNIQGSKKDFLEYYPT
jgi:hypothetical protein